MIWGIIGIALTIAFGFYALVKGRQADKLQRENKELLLKNKALQEEQRKDTMKIKKGVAKIEKKMIDGFTENTPPDEPLRKEMKKADSFYYEKKYKEAYNLYNKINKKALSSGKEKLFVLSMMGKSNCVGMQKDYQKAIEILKNAEEYENLIDKKAKVKLYFNLGYCNQTLKNNDLAIEYYSRSLGINPRVANAYNNRGIVYKDKEEYERAIWDFDKAIEVNPEYAEAYNNRGNAYVNKGEYERAIQDYDKAIKLYPDFAVAYNNRGEAYADKREYERAIRDFDKAIKLEPELAEAYYKRGNAYAEIGNNKEAIKSYKKFIEVATGEYKKEITHAKQRIKELQKK